MNLCEENDVFSGGFSAVLFKLLKMPRRLPVRPGKILGNVFVLLVGGVMSFIYYTYVSLWGPRATESIWVMLMLVAFNFLFVMLLWSFV